MTEWGAAVPEQSPRLWKPNEPGNQGFSQGKHEFKEKTEGYSPDSTVQSVVQPTQASSAKITKEFHSFNTLAPIDRLGQW
jgi:hypothetical protein